MALEGAIDSAPQYAGADYVIVGAGAAGCVLAEQLSADGKAQVILIEAGPRDRSPFITMPKGLGQIAANADFNWAYQVPGDGAFGGEIWPRGRTLGGSTSTNGFIYNRGRPEDYDALERAGATGWNWRAIERCFVALEDHELGPGQSRGTGGPLHVTMPRQDNPLYAAWIAAGRDLGLEVVDDLNAPRAFHSGAIGLMPRTIHRGRRWSAARAFLDRARRRTNLRILANVSADRITMANGRATGVECSGAISGRIAARCEVIVAAGAIASPALLQRSGIGDPVMLARAGVPVRVDNAGVGANLAEHRNAYHQFRMRDAANSFNRGHRSWRLVANAVRYWLMRGGLLADGPCEVGAFIRSLPHSERPDAQLLFMPVSMGPVAPGSARIVVEDEPGITIVANQLRPVSRGSIRISGPEATAPIEIRPNYLTAEVDCEIAVGATRFIRRLVNDTSIAGQVVQEIGPMASADSDGDIVKGWLAFGGPGCHATGTCRMGSDAAAVLDPELRVRGVGGLRVCDNSIFPFLVAGNTAAAVMAAALRAAQLIRRDETR